MGYRVGWIIESSGGPNKPYKSTPPINHKNIHKILSLNWINSIALWAMMPSYKRDMDFTLKKVKHKTTLPILKHSCIMNLGANL